jgi:beta-1,4-mannosyl-glycoprotein beta-1,4-N-acetylglucosaminyltransferase
MTDMKQVLCKDRKVIDCFTFFNEIGLLTLRIEELTDVVDYFVIVEARHTFSGREKDFNFEKYKNDFSSISDKIIYVKINALPPLFSDTEKDRFWLEAYQRNCILLGLSEVTDIDKNDIILLSDVDEIPSKDAVKQLRTTELQCDALGFEQELYYYNISNMPSISQWNSKWLGTVAFQYELLGRVRPHDIRTYVRETKQLVIGYIENAGWHLTYFGSEQSVHYKKANFAHGACDSSMKYEQDVTSDLNVGTKLIEDVTIDMYKKIYDVFSALKFNLPSGMLNSPIKYIRYILG